MILNNEAVCCQLRIDGRMSLLPFSQVIATDYYDGPIEGLTSCAICKRAYSFRKLDWDYRQDLRVLGLAPVPISLEDIATQLMLKMQSPPRITFIPPLNEIDKVFVDQLLNNPVVIVTVITTGWQGESKVWKTTSNPEFNTLDALISQLVRGLDLDS